MMLTTALDLWLWLKSPRVMSLSLCFTRFCEKANCRGYCVASNFDCESRHNRLLRFLLGTRVALFAFYCVSEMV